MHPLWPESAYTVSMLVPVDNVIACEKLLSYKRALFIGAHPDDIEFRAGGLVYLMRQRDIDVTFAIATRGGRNLPRVIRGPLEAIREKQQHDAAEILGGISVWFFDYPDGRLSGFVQPLTQDLQELIADVQPDIVLSWDPEHIFTDHPDHQAAADAAQAAASAVDTCWYGTKEPNLWIGVDEEALRVKVRAIKAHRTETPWFYFDARLKKRMIAAMLQDGAEIGCDYGETFRFTPQRPRTQPS